MNVPYEFDEARREEHQLQLQGAPSRPLEYRLSGLNMDIDFSATEDGHEWLKSAISMPTITFEMEPLPVEFQIAVIRAGWEVQYGIMKAEVMERIAERKADNEMIPMLDAVAQVDREARAAWVAWQAAVKIAAAKMAEVAAAFCDLRDAMVAAFNETWPWVVNTLEEIQKLVEEYAAADELEEPDRHDGAVEVLVTWLPPVPTLYELYGQGVDHGGPGPSRLTLTRVTDDGLWRAETGTNQERRQQNEEMQGLRPGRTGRPGRCDHLGEEHPAGRPGRSGEGGRDQAAA